MTHKDYFDLLAILCWLPFPALFAFWLFKGGRW